MSQFDSELIVLIESSLYPHRFVFSRGVSVYVIYMSIHSTVESLGEGGNGGWYME